MSIGKDLAIFPGGKATTYPFFRGKRWLEERLLYNTGTSEARNHHLPDAKLVVYHYAITINFFSFNYIKT
jgi:hypothetical protein